MSAPRRIGTWAIDGELGRGGMGVVFRGHGPAGEPVAIKLLTASSQAARRRLEGEARTLMRLEHPNLVRVRATGEHQGMPYLVMDLVEGESLAARLEREGPLEPRRAAALTLALARALAHCHAAGVLHRDIKPANVLLDRRGEPYLVDFGLAFDLDAARSRMTIEGAALGTPGYWPPEQARGDLSAIEERSDVYALGATLYAMLTGQPPFQGESLLELLEAAVNLAPTPPSGVHGRGHPELDALVLSCLAKSPAARPESAQALAAALERWLRGDPAVRRARRAWIALATLLLLGLGGLALDRARRGARARAAALIERARMHGRTDEVALALVDSALALHDDPWTRLYRAELLGGLERGDEARAEVERALPALRTAAGPWLVRATLRPAAEADQALADVAEALRREPDSARALEIRAGLRERTGDLEGALADATRLVQLQPGEAGSWVGRARLRFQRGDTPGALEDATRALRVDPRSRQALVLRAELRERSGDEAGALADYYQAARLTPARERGGPVSQLAALRNKRREQRQLVTELDALLAEEETCERYTLRGQAFQRLGEIARARADLLRAVELDPKDLYAWNSTGALEFSQRRYEAAEQAFTRSIELSPGTLRLYMNRAGARIEREDWEGAAADLGRVLNGEPKNAAAHLRMGVLRHRQGRQEEAVLHYDQALALDPNLAQAHSDRANSLLELGRPGEALASLRAARDLLPPGQERAQVDHDIRRVEALLAPR